MALTTNVQPGDPNHAGLHNEERTVINSLSDQVAALPAAYNDEKAQDAAAALLTSGVHTGLTASYDDVNNRVNLNVTNQGTAYTDEQAQDAAALLFTTATHSGLTATYDDVNNKLSLAVNAVTPYTDEQAQDAAASLLTTGVHSGITASYDDVNNRVNLVATGGATTTYVTPVTLVADGTLAGGGTDNTTALNTILRDATNSGKSVIIPNGVYRVDGVIGGSGANRIVDNLTILAGNKRGTGNVVLVSTVPANAALRVDGVTGFSLVGVTLEAANVVSRTDGFNTYRLSCTSSTDTIIDRVRVGGGAAAGMYFWNCNGVILRQPTVDNTLADGIHITGGSKNGVIIDPVVTNSADDQLAFVDYEIDVPTYGHVQNWTVYRPALDGQNYGRGLSILGGVNIYVYDIDIKNTTHAGIYSGCEQPASFWKPSTAYTAGQSVMPSAPKSNGYKYTVATGGTSGTTEPNWVASGATGATSDNTVTWTGSNGYLTAANTNVKILGGVLSRANTNTTVDHGAISLQSQRTDVLNNDLEIRNIEVIDPAPGHPSAVVNGKGNGWALAGQTTIVDGITIRGMHNPSYPWSVDGYATLAALTTNGFKLTQPIEIPDSGERLVKSVSSAYTVSASTDQVVVCTGSTAFTVTLPAAAVLNGTNATSREYTIANNGTATITISGPTGSPTLTAGQFARFISDGTSWVRVG